MLAIMAHHSDYEQPWIGMNLIDMILCYLVSIEVMLACLPNNMLRVLVESVSRDDKIPWH